MSQPTADFSRTRPNAYNVYLLKFLISKHNQRTAESFLARVQPTKKCWNWIGSVSNIGYGRFYRRFTGNETYAHRWAYILFVGEIPEGLDVHHTCHNRLCVNPRHLRAVTHQENIRHREEHLRATGRRSMRGHYRRSA